MAKKVNKMIDESTGTVGYMFDCPGCECSHLVYTSGKGVPNWKFNGNEEKPTFRPSILVTIARPKGDYICHSYVTDGIISYEADTTHKLSGLNVELPDSDD